MKVFPYEKDKMEMLVGFIVLAALSLESVHSFIIGSTIIGTLTLVAFLIPAIIFLFIYIYYFNFYIIFGDLTITIHHTFMKKDIVVRVDSYLKIYLPNENTINDKKLKFAIQYYDEAYIYKIDKKTVEALLIYYPNNVERYEKLNDIFAPGSKKKTVKSALIVLGIVVASILAFAAPLIPIFISSVGLSTNYFKDQERMTDYAYVCNKYGSLFYDNHEIAFKEPFKSTIGEYGRKNGMTDADMTGSYIVTKDYFYYAISYLNNDGYYALQIRRRSFNEIDDLEEIYSETGFEYRPYSFSGFDTKMHFYSFSTYLFSYDVKTNIREDSLYERDAHLADKYYLNNGMTTEEVNDNYNPLILKNGTTSVDVKNGLPEIYQRLNKHSYVPKTVVYLDDYAFIFYDSESCDYDACLRYNFTDNKLSFANTYWDRYGFGIGYQIIIPVLSF